MPCKHRIKKGAKGRRKSENASPAPWMSLIILRFNMLVIASPHAKAVIVITLTLSRHFKPFMWSSSTSFNVRFALFGVVFLFLFGILKRQHMNRTTHTSADVEPLKWISQTQERMIMEEEWRKRLLITCKFASFWLNKNSRAFSAAERMNERELVIAILSACFSAQEPLSFGKSTWSINFPSRFQDATQVPRSTKDFNRLACRCSSQILTFDFLFSF